MDHNVSYRTLNWDRMSERLLTYEGKVSLYGPITSTIGGGRPRPIPRYTGPPIHPKKSPSHTLV